MLWGDSSLACPAICPGPVNVGFRELANSSRFDLKTGLWAVGTTDVVSAPERRGQSMGGIEEGKQLGHRKTQAFGVRLTWV